MLLFGFTVGDCCDFLRFVAFWDILFFGTSYCCDLSLAGGVILVLNCGFSSYWSILCYASLLIRW